MLIVMAREQDKDRQGTNGEEIENIRGQAGTLRLTRGATIVTTCSHGSSIPYLVISGSVALLSNGALLMSNINTYQFVSPPSYSTQTLPAFTRSQTLNYNCPRLPPSCAYHEPSEAELILLSADQKTSSFPFHISPSMNSPSISSLYASAFLPMFWPTSSAPWLPPSYNSRWLPSSSAVATSKPMLKLTHPLPPKPLVNHGHDSTRLRPPRIPQRQLCEQSDSEYVHYQLWAKRS